MNQIPSSRNKKEFAIFIGGLPGNIKHKEVFAYFSSRYDCPLKVYLKFKKNGISAGYGTVKLSEKDQYERIIAKTHVINGRQIECRPYYSTSKFAKFQKSFYNCRVYVTKIPLNVDNNKLKEIFSVVGEVVKAYLIKENKQKNVYNFGYVVFKKHQDATKAVKIQKFFFQGKALVCKKFDQKKKQKDQGAKENKSNNDSQELNQEGFDFSNHLNYFGNSNTGYQNRADFDERINRDSHSMNRYQRLSFEQPAYLNNSSFYNFAQQQLDSTGSTASLNSNQDLTGLRADFRLSDILSSNWRYLGSNSNQLMEKASKVGEIIRRGKNPKLSFVRLANSRAVKLTHLNFDGNLVMRPSRWPKEHQLDRREWGWN